MAEDARLTAAREWVDTPEMRDDIVVIVEDAAEVMSRLIAYAEERQRVNLGIMQENAALKAKLQQPEEVNLESVPDSTLIAELNLRLRELRQRERP